MKDAYYFPHDANARHDLKMTKLRRKHGMAGVGVFWCIIEMLRETSDYSLNTSDIDDISYELQCDTVIIDELFTCKLLIKEGEKFFSNSLNARMKNLDAIKQKRSDAGQKGGRATAELQQNISNAIAMPQQSESNVVANDKQIAASKEKKRKEKESKEKNLQKPASPTVPEIPFPADENEVKKFFHKSGYNLQPAREFYALYSQSEWKDRNGKPITNWHEHAKKQWFTEKNKNKPSITR